MKLPAGSLIGIWVRRSNSARSGCMVPSLRRSACVFIHGARTYSHKTNAHTTNAHKTNAHTTNAHNTNGKRDICSQLFL